MMTTQTHLNPGWDGAAFRRLRLERGITQGDIAAKTIRTKSAVGRWERGERTPPTRVVGIVARLLHVPVESLMVGEHDDS